MAYGKVFMINGNFPVIRAALKRRNWTEQISVHSRKELMKYSQHSLLLAAQEGNDFEIAAISKFLKNNIPNFIWNLNRISGTFKLADFKGHDPFRNRIRRKQSHNFTSKEGLSAMTENSHWFQIEEIAELNCPPSFILTNEENKKSFFREFKRCSCRSFLNFLNSQSDLRSLFNAEGTVDPTSIDYAIKVLRVAIDEVTDMEVDDDHGTTFDVEFNDHFKNFEAITRREAHFREMNNVDTGLYVWRMRRVLTEGANIWPFMKYEGYRNMWILKPGNRCRGIGINIFSDVKKIFRFVQNKDTRYVVQKYIGEYSFH
jgi:tubulin monoglycylase TTLL3/8